MQYRRDRSGAIDQPGIPGADNHWYASQGEARRAALAAANQRSPGYSIVHDPQPTRGQPHYHVVNRATGQRVSGHFFYGRRPPRRVLRGRPSREYELLPAAEAELEQCLARVDRAIRRRSELLAAGVPLRRDPNAPEFLIGDPAAPANQGRDPNPHHDRVIAQVVSAVTQSGWQDIRREQTQVAGGVRNPIEATQVAQAPTPGLNFPDVSGVDRQRRRTHIEIDTDRAASRDHQVRIFAADANPALGGSARKARGVFVVIDPATGRVTSVRHVRHNPRGGQPVVRETTYGSGGVPMQTLITRGVLSRPVSQRAAQQPVPARGRRAPRRRQREAELEPAGYF